MESPEIGGLLARVSLRVRCAFVDAPAAASDEGAAERAQRSNAPRSANDPCGRALPSKSMAGE